MTSTDGVADQWRVLWKKMDQLIQEQEDSSKAKELQLFLN